MILDCPYKEEMSPSGAECCLFQGFLTASMGWKETSAIAIRSLVVVVSVVSPSVDNQANHH
jgi:hypothetical protein